MKSVFKHLFCCWCCCVIEVIDSVSCLKASNPKGTLYSGVWYLTTFDDIWLWYLMIFDAIWWHIDDIWWWYLMMIWGAQLSAECRKVDKGDTKWVQTCHVTLHTAHNTHISNDDGVTEWVNVHQSTSDVLNSVWKPRFTRARICAHLCLIIHNDHGTFVVTCHTVTSLFHYIACTWHLHMQYLVRVPTDVTRLSVKVRDLVCVWWYLMHTDDIWWCLMIFDVHKNYFISSQQSDF